MSGQAQIVNIESERIRNDTLGWDGSVAVNFSINKSAKTLYSLGSDFHLQYKKDRSLFLLLLKAGLIQSDEESFSNFAFSHLRYNYKVNELLRWELFTQLQSNKILNLEKRWLIGSGPRFKLTQKEKFQSYLGVIYMYEYEEEQIDEVVLYHRNHRLSNYISFTLEPWNNSEIALINTTYYQPNLESFSDYRILTETEFVLPIRENIKFSLTYSLVYDNDPPPETVNTLYNLSNSLKATF